MCLSGPHRFIVPGKAMANGTTGVPSGKASVRFGARWRSERVDRYEATG